MSYGSYFGDALILPALWQGLWQAMNSLGIMIGASSNGILQDKFGRRPMFFAGGAIAAVGTYTCATVPNISYVIIRTDRENLQNRRRST
jgi:MFS family permease